MFHWNEMLAWWLPGCIGFHAFSRAESSFVLYHVGFCKLWLIIAKVTNEILVLIAFAQGHSLKVHADQG